MSAVVERIKTIIETEVPEATVYVASPDGDHFEALVISPAFETLSLVKQHQMVMKALKSEFEGDMHALQLSTFTPAKWETARERYNVG